MIRTCMKNEEFFFEFQTFLKEPVAINVKAIESFHPVKIKGEYCTEIKTSAKDYIVSATYDEVAEKFFGAKK